MRQPMVFKADAIKHWNCDKKLPNNVWVPARPESGGFSWRWRWRLAVDVFFGRADALFWD